MITLPLPSARASSSSPTSPSAPRAVPAPECDPRLLSEAHAQAEEEMPPLWVLLLLPLALVAVSAWWTGRRVLRTFRAF